MDDAQQHIETIRHDFLGGRILDTQSRLYGTLTGALGVISEKIHHKNCHFLNELVQNFDDTEYTKVPVPTALFSLTETHFYAWSNEDGFTKDNVDSLCSIGHSSKADNLESTGENGIGFKSIFKVADEVTIQSHPYTFTFDTASELGQLGMLVPTWVDKPRDPKDGTLLTIRLKNQPEILTAVSDQLKNFDFYSSLFSRALRQIEIRHRLQGNFTTTIAYLGVRSKSDSTQDLFVLRDYAPSTIERFYIRNHDAKLASRESSRKQPTKIRLAFPIRDKNDEVSHRQIYFAHPFQPTEIRHAFPIGCRNDEASHQQTYFAYAFQPIQNFGFSFMIHADFILDASRSSVEPEKAWNRELETHISTTIVEALTWLATDINSPMALQWPNYLRCLERVDGEYFQRIASKVKKELRSLKLVMMELETVGGDTRRFCCPQVATIVDSRFRYEGRPLLDHPENLATLVSSKYDEQALDDLMILGIAEMDDDSFYRQFVSMVDRQPTYFRNKSGQWHSAVASVLLWNPNRAHLKQFLRSSAIVPLNGGTWTVPRPESTFLPNEAAPPIPSDFSIQTVSSDACDDPWRSLLFTELGLRKCDFSDVHRVILEDRGTKTWSHKQLLDQAVYLFLTGYKPRDLPFTFTDSRGETTSSKLVFLSKSTGAFRRQLYEGDLEISWLHEDYYSPRTIDNNQRISWRNWLYQWENILDIGPAISINGQLSSAFKVLWDRCGFDKALNLLRLSSSLPFSNSNWCKNIGDLKVSTTHGRRNLSETALPSLDKEADGMVPLIMLESSDHDWSFLKHFGVCVSVDMRFFLHQLSYLSANKPGTDLLTTTKLIYNRLGKLTMDDLEISTLRDAFANTDLILAQDGRWYSAHEFRWHSKFTCTRYRLLRDQYQDCRRFFYVVLGIKSTDLGDLINEIHDQSNFFSVTPKQDKVIKSMRDLLQNLGNMLKSRTSSEKVSELKTLEMFPVMTHEGQRTLQSANSGEFWIPDISVLHECFRGCAPLLELGDDAYGTNISTIVSVLGLKSRLLTEAVQDRYNNNMEQGREDTELERNLGSKTGYIERILRAEGQSAEQITTRINQVKEIKARKVPQIMIERYVVGKNSQFVGKETVSDLRIITEGQNLLLLVREGSKPDVVDRLLRREMTRLLEISKHSDLLGDLLAADDPESLLEDLERAGAHQMHLAAVPAGERTSTSEEVDRAGDSDDSTDSNLEAALQKSTSVKTDKQRHFSASPKSSEGSSESTGYTVCTEGTSPTPIPATTAPSIRTTPNRLRSSLLQRGTGSADTSSVDFLTSALANVSVADDGLEDAIPATRAPRVIASHGARDSLSPWKRPRNIDTHRRSRSLGQPPTTTAQVWRGSLPHHHHRPQDGSSGVSQPDSSSERKKEIGRKGEHILYTFLQGELGSSFNEKYWTSNGRKHYIPTCPDHHPGLCLSKCPKYYSIDEGKYADFTIADSEASQAFTKYLRTNWRWNRSVDCNTKYHLEVKSTPNRVENDAFWTLSPNQIRMARRHSVNLITVSEPLTDVYILVRVFDIDVVPRLWFVVDPWASTSLYPISDVAMRPTVELKSDTLAVARGYPQESAHDAELPAPESEGGRRASGSFLSAVGQNVGEGGQDDLFEFTFEFAQPDSVQVATAPSTLHGRFEPLIERDTGGYTMAYQSITFMDRFKNYSFEEVKLADYEPEPDNSGQ